MLLCQQLWGHHVCPHGPPYCLVYLTSYVRDAVPDHFDTHNNLAGMCLHHCICHATLQFTNDNTKQLKEYSGSHLILPRRAQYNDQLFPMILKPWNHQELLIDSAMKEPYPMELVGDFWAADPIFKGCYRDSLLYSNVELCRFRWRGIHLPAYQGEIPMPLAPSYQQARESEASKKSPPRAAAPDMAVESPKTKSSSGKCSPHHSLGHSSNTSTPKRPDSTSVKKPPSSKEPTSNARRSLQRLTALTSMAIPLPQPPSQSDTNGKMFTWKTPTHSTPLFPSAPACLMASAVQCVPTAM